MQTETRKMQSAVLKVHPDDNIIVALHDFQAGDRITIDDLEIVIRDTVRLKHKFAAIDFAPGDRVVMYGVTVGKAITSIPQGTCITTKNVHHATGQYDLQRTQYSWIAPDVSHFSTLTFNGYHRADGKVGTRNYWLVIPLVFCENRNIQVIKDAMLEQLGYVTDRDFSVNVDKLISRYREGANASALLETDIIHDSAMIQRNRLFQNVDGIRFLTHDGGCGGIRQDSETLCRLLAGYVTHSNVAGATILSLGCQNAQYKLFEDALQALDPKFNKPLYVLEQQKSNSEREFIADAVKQTFVGLMEANKIKRSPAPLHHLKLGLECGGSDGFSGISANPALGYASDLLVALGGTAILSEFPELNGVEQELINRCKTEASAMKFTSLMQNYANRAKESGSGFDMNPSPGNIKDGLITDAMKSAGAAKKGGTSPVTAILDYTEQATEPGLNLLCTPGNDVESTTGLAGSGANMIVFTTGLGTPTGNPITPTIKMSSNSALAQRMPDLIDIDAGTIMTGEDTITTKGEELLRLIITIASGELQTHAERLGQNDFIPWKRGVSL